MQDYALIPLSEIPYMRDMLRKVAGRSSVTEGDPVTSGYDNRNHGIVFIKNTTGTDLSPGDAVTLGDPVDDDDEFLLGTMVYETATFDNEKLVAVVQAVIAENEIGPAVIAGTALVVVDIDDDDDEFVIADTSTSFTSTSATSNQTEPSYRILWKESGTGPGKKATILLPNVSVGAVTVIGPCVSYTPDVADPPTDFETAYPGGCEGPDVLGLNLRNITTGVTTVYRMEVVSTGPLVFETVETFSLSCGGVSITCYGRVTVNDLDRSIETYSGGWTFSGVVGSIVKDSDDSILQEYRNALYSYNPKAGGNLQLGPEATTCDCGTLPYDLCLSIPTA